MSTERRAAQSELIKNGDEESSLESAHLLASEEVLAELGGSKDGISAEEAQSRFVRFGPNELKEQSRVSAWKRMLLQFHNPLIYVLSLIHI